MTDPSEHAGFVFNILQHANSDARLTPAAKCVVFWLTHHSDRETRMCWPSIGRLSKLARCDKKTVGRAIRDLEASGYLEVMREHRQNNVYTLLEQEKWDMKRFMKRNQVEGKNVPQRMGKMPPNVGEKCPSNHLIRIS
jgi:Helix-turn-helix domain